MMRLSRLLTLAVTALLTACAAAPTRPFAPVAARAQTVDVLHYDIALTIDHQAGYVSGSVDVFFAALDEAVHELVLDAVDLNIERVLDEHGQKTRFATGPDTLTISLPQVLQPGQSTNVHIDYDGFPQRGLYFVAPTGRDPERPWHIWSQGQSHDTRHWLPVWEQLTDRATHTLALTVDDQFMTLAAGELVGSARWPGRRTRTDSWSMTTPHPAYLITLVVGELAVGELPRDELSDEAIPLPLVARERDLEAAAFATRYTADMLSFMNDFTGLDYPYVKYAQTFVDEFSAGGMENISATTLYDEGLHAPADEPQLDISGLVAHELAHQWFGDLLSCNDWAHLWINEGWADYVELLYHGSLHGTESMGARALAYQRAGCQAELDASRPVIWHGYSDPDECFEDHNYNGAAARIRLLADQLGPDVFSECVHAWVAWAAGRQVDTDDLQRVFSETSGQDLGRFFDEWFRGPGYPRFEVRVEHGDVLVARQVQGVHGWPEVFHVTLEARWSRGGVEHSARFACDSVETRVELAGAGSLDWVGFDSAHVLPGTVEVTQTQDAWAAQLSGAQDGVIRLLAAQWFDFHPWVSFEQTHGEYGPSELAALSSAARDDTLVDVRLAALSAISFEGGEQVQRLVAELAEDGDARVRELAMSALARHVPRAPELHALLRAGLNDESSAVAVAAATALAEIEEPGLLATLRRLINDRDAVRLDRDLVELAAALDDPARIPFLIGVARQHPERWVRTAAVEGLGNVTGPQREAAFRQLCTSLHDESYDVRATAAAALGDSDDARAETQLRARWDLETDPVVLSALEDALGAMAEG